MGDVLKAVGSVASVFIPGAAPIVAGISAVTSAFSGGSSGTSASPAPAPIGTPWPSIASTLADVTGVPDYSTGSDPGAADTGPLEAPRTWIPSVASGAGVPDYIYPPPLGMAGQTYQGAVGTALQVVGGMGVGALVGRGIAAIEAVVPKWVAAAGGSALAASIYELYKRLRGSGQPHKAARHAALAAHGVMLRRRRMRVTNVHALNRAIRRVRGFQRKARKVRHLFGSARAAHPSYGRKRHFRRGDLDPFLMEDRAEMRDEAEDFDLEPMEAVYE